MTLRHILRRLASFPALTAITVATLAIGIGANSAIFAVIENVLLKPLPFPDSAQLIDVNHTAPGVNFVHARVAPFLYFTYREQARSFQSIGLWRQNANSLTGLAEPEHVRSLEVTAEVLPMVGVEPFFGRLFSPGDTLPNAPLTVLLSDALWRDKFGANPAVLGRQIVIDGKPHEIIGVLPRNLWFMDVKPAIALPLQFDRNQVFLGNFAFTGIARLKSGVTIQQASAECDSLIPVAIQSFPPVPGISLSLFRSAHLTTDFLPLKQSLLGNIGGVLWVLSGTIGMVLLIACANVANLMLVRTYGRQHELAVRAALGARWWRIARELLLESVVLGLAGGAVGLTLALGALRLLQALNPANLPRLGEISMDTGGIVFTVVASVLAGLLFGLLPALRYSGRRMNLALRANGRISESREGHGARNTLVVVQVALALVLLISSGLMIRTFQALRHVEPGFTQPQEIQTFEISIPQSVVADPVAVTRIEQDISGKIAAIPGVSRVAVTTEIPMAGGHWFDPIEAEDRNEFKATARTFKFVSPGLLATMGNRLVAGRDFTWDDIYDRHRVAMLSEGLARDLWGTPEAAIGKHVRYLGNSPWREVVGIVADERADGVDRPAPKAVYWPLLMDQFENSALYCSRDVAYIVRTPRAGSSSLIQGISQAVWSVGKELPLANPRTLQEIYGKSLARASFALVMLGLAAAMALLLGIAGIYGVISYAVTQRTREIGIRVALGAQGAQVKRMFVREGAMLAAIGILCGTAAAFGLMRLMGSLLFGVAPFDPLTYAAVAVALAAAAAIASYIPAMRATRVDPVEALRAD